MCSAVGGWKDGLCIQLRERLFQTRKGDLGDNTAAGGIVARCESEEVVRSVSLWDGGFLVWLASGSAMIGP